MTEHTLRMMKLAIELKSRGISTLPTPMRTQFELVHHGLMDDRETAIEYITFLERELAKRSLDVDELEEGWDEESGRHADLMFNGIGAMSDVEVLILICHPVHVITAFELIREGRIHNEPIASEWKS